MGALESILATDQVKLIIGFLVGAIIGLERQLSAIRKEKEEIENIEEEKELKPGVRTFGLISLYGAMTTIFANRFSSREIFYFSIASILVIIGIYTVMKYQIQDYGLTTPVALAVAFVLGSFVGVGEITLAITLSVLVTFILTSKRYVVRFLRGLEFKEIRSALEIGILFFLFFPIIPDANDPFFNAINLRTLYLFMVVVLTLSFIAYILVKNMSPVKGLLSFSALGAVFSSEGVTVNLVRLYNEKPEKRIEVVTRLGIITANTVMVIRTLVLTSLLLIPYPSMIIELSFYILPSVMMGLLLVGYRYYGKLDIIEEGRRPHIENPLSYKTASKFVAAFIAISFIVILLRRIGSTLGFLFGSFIGGFVSNLAVSLSIASLVLSGKITVGEAETAIILGTLAAILNKIIYVRVESKKRGILVGSLLDIILLAIPLGISLVIINFLR